MSNKFFSQCYGILDGSTILCTKKVDVQAIDMATEVAFFYGLPEVGRNVVWRDITPDPTMFLSYYQKVKSYLKPVQVVLR